MSTTIPSSEPPLTSTPIQEAIVDLEESFEDGQEAEHSLGTHVGRKVGPNKSPCSKLLTKETIMKFRNENMELTKDELDLVILSHSSAD